MELKVKTYSTKEVGKLLEVPANYIQQLVWKDSLDAPQKVGRSYRWTPKDIERASWKIRGRSANDVLPTEQEESKKTDKPESKQELFSKLCEALSSENIIEIYSSKRQLNDAGVFVGFVGVALG